MYGRRRMLLVSLMLLIGGSVIGALSVSLVPLIVARTLRGLATEVIPLGISIMRDELPAGRLGGATALMRASLCVGGALGLPIAALVADSFNWHVLFRVAAVRRGGLTPIPHDWDVRNQAPSFLLRPKRTLTFSAPTRAQFQTRRISPSRRRRSGPSRSRTRSPRRSLWRAGKPRIRRFHRSGRACPSGRRRWPFRASHLQRRGTGVG
jgi:MFS family permease